MASSRPSQLSASASAKMQRRRERPLFSTSDDTAMMKQVQSTHAPDGREVDVQPIILVIEEILIHAIARTVEGDVDVLYVYPSSCFCLYSLIALLVIFYVHVKYLLLCFCVCNV